MPKRRHHTIGCKGNILNPIEIPITREDLELEWNHYSQCGQKKAFVSFYYFKNNRLTEYIYAMRFRNADLKKGIPLIQLAFIRDAEQVYWTENTKFSYLCGYGFDFDEKNNMTGYHVPKRCEPYLKYAKLPVLYTGFEDVKGFDKRPHPGTFTARNTKYNLSNVKALPDFKYIPESAWKEIDIDPTYYFDYFKRNPLVAEYLAKMGHPEAVRDRRWFSTTKEKFIAMVRYAQKRLPERATWSYTNIAYNMKRNTNYSTTEIQKLGRVKNSIPWATDRAIQKEVLHYLEKQKSDLETYKHYLQMREELDLGSDSHSARFPSSLGAAHTRLTLEITKKEDTLKDEKMQKAVQGVIITSDCYTPIIPQSFGELKGYGKVMDNCLGWEHWVNKISDHESFIFILGRTEEGTAVPYLACEVVQTKNQLTIKQLYRPHNEIASEDERRYVRTKILPQLETQLKLLPARSR